MISQLISQNLATQQSRLAIPKISKNQSSEERQASFRSKTTDLNVSHVLNLMEAMMSEHLSLFHDNFQFFLFLGSSSDETPNVDLSNHYSTFCEF